MDSDKPTASEEEEREREGEAEGEGRVEGAPEQGVSRSWRHWEMSDTGANEKKKKKKEQRAF